jgi:hypothetical protein
LGAGNREGTGGADTGTGNYQVGAKPGRARGSENHDISLKPRAKTPFIGKFLDFGR